MALNNPLPVYELVIVGDGGVGKTQITLQFLQQIFIEEYNPTIDELYTRHIFFDNKVGLLNVSDNGDQKKLNYNLDHNIGKGDGFMIVYSVVDRKSFDEVPKFVQNIVKIKGRDKIPILLVANKVDLVHLRQISKIEGRDMSKRFNLSYIETSARDPAQNITSAFHKVVRLMHNYHPSAVTSENPPRRWYECSIL